MPRPSLSIPIAALLVLFCALVPIAAAQQSEEDRDVLLVGTKEAPPFAMKSANGRWSGISIELWEEVAEVLGLHFEY